MDQATRAAPAVGEVLITVPEAARRLAISRSYLYQYLQRGRLPSVHIGRARRIRVTWGSHGARSSWRGRTRRPESVSSSSAWMAGSCTWRLRRGGARDQAFLRAIRGDRLEAFFLLAITSGARLGEHDAGGAAILCALADARRLQVGHLLLASNRSPDEVAE
jgi:excisionase family DNA binding protein